VIAIARTPTAELSSAAAAIELEQRGALHFRAFDLANTAAIATLVGGLRKEFGPIYGLVNNAGLRDRGGADDHAR